MPRSDLLLALIRSASRRDDATFRRSLEAMIAEERSKQHHVLADRMSEYLAIAPKAVGLNGHSDQDPARDLLLEFAPQRRLNDLILDDGVSTSLLELVSEQLQQDRLRSFGLEPRSKLLLVGEPGNGKTSVAEAVAEALATEFLVVKYEAVVGSFLGETSTRLSRVFDFARTRRCVLFLDEFDTLAKERGDPHDTGEVKRVVSSLLLQIDSLPTYVVVVAATNHAELLDRAVRRRFDLILELRPPTARAFTRWLDLLEARLEFPLARLRPSIRRTLKDLSFAELEKFELDVLRRHVLDPSVPRAVLIKERLEAWRAAHD